MNPPPLMSRCGLPLPLPVDFSTDAHMDRPLDVVPPTRWDLADINSVNVRIERDNKASIAFTKAYAEARGFPGGVGALNVGANLKPFYEYPEEFKELLIKAPLVCDATGPLPTFMVIWIASQRIKNSKAESDKKDARDAERSRGARPTKGTLVMGPLHRILSTSDALVPIPDCYENYFCNKIYFPLHWWSDKQLQLFANQPHSIPKTNISENRVTVVDMAKAERLLSTDDFNVLTPGLWRQVSVNQLRAFENICAAPVPGDPTSPATSYAVEYKKHILFFTALHCFEEIKMFEVWFCLEAALRAEVFNNGIFDTLVWETKWGIAASTREQLPFWPEQEARCDG
ncbi:hypothetical protein K438DRAFT_1763645 [Mycena galopus ATCC 62051]|nr:hypothetical protein K438DRAFT_1763645 [Mycena galopus ATCC 62051]